MNISLQDGLVEGRPPSAPGPDGRSTRWDAHREQRKAQILDATRRLIHARGASVTMEDIAQASGTSKSILYRYFRDRSEVQRALGLHLFNHMHRELQRSAQSKLTPNERLEAMVVAFVGAASRSANLFEFVMQPSTHLNHFLASVRRLVRSALPPELDEVEATLYAAAAVSLVQGTTERWMSAPTTDPIAALSPEDVSTLIVSYLTSPPLATSPATTPSP